MTMQFRQVEFGTETVGVPAGGYYDRFHMKPDLDAVARDPAAGNIEFFKAIPKQKVMSRVGPIWAPNFYYRSSNVQLLFLAPIDRLRAALPEPLEPIKAFPGYGLVALTFFSYAVCDNDPYNEVSVAVVVRRPGRGGSNIAELIESMRRRSFFAHVLALPVDTENARVRGVQGYQLPKWLADIDMRIDGDVTATIAALDGTPDLSLKAPLPAFTTVTPQSRMGTSTMVHKVDGQWCQTSVQANILSYTEKLFPRDVKLERYGGPLSQLLDGLGAKRMLRFDVVKDAQLVLNLPVPLEKDHLCIASPIQE